MRKEPEVLAVAAAFSVWCSAIGQLSALAKLCLTVGERPLAEQRRRHMELLNAQLLEAFARGQIQSTIQKLVDGVDTSTDIVGHWAEFWGDDAAERAWAAWQPLYEAELNALERNLAKANEVAAAHDAAGV